MRKAVVGLLIVACMAGGLYLWRGLDASGPTQIDEARDSRAVPSDKSAVQSMAPAAVADGVRAASSELVSEPGLAEQFAAAKDLWEFAESVLPRAQAGDAAAQFYLFKALRYCDDGYRFYFDRGGKRRTLDQALQWASTRPTTSLDEVREIHQKCFRLKESTHSFGAGDDWLFAANSKHFPLANMEMAQRLWGQSVKAQGNPHDALPDEAQRLALLALRSKDPEVLFQFGDLTGMFRDVDSASQEQWVWRLAACQRGYDCSSSAEWLRAFCRFDRNCQPYEGGVDFIRRNNPGDFEEIDTLARDLNAKLDADQFDQVVEARLRN